MLSTRGSSPSFNYHELLLGYLPGRAKDRSIGLAWPVSSNAQRTVGGRNGAYDARFPDLAFPDDTRASGARIADTHHVHARNSTGNQMLAGPFRAICLCGRRADAEAARSDAEFVGRGIRRARATHQLFDARPIKRSLYDFAMRASRRAAMHRASSGGNQRGILRVSTRENRGGSLRPADPICADRVFRCMPAKFVIFGRPVVGITAVRAQDGYPQRWCMRLTFKHQPRISIG